MSDCYLGLMSGTSMDSIDAVLIDFSQTTPTLLSTYHLAITDALKQRLLSLCQTPTHPQLGELDNELGELFAQAALQVMKNGNVKSSAVRAIGSHGQTVFHQPPLNNKPGFSVQIADPNIIALRTKVTTVADFRRKDMVAGGQGAPLVPAFHQAIFHSKEKNRVIVNIGGMANITVLPTQGKVTGFDTGPGNVLLDLWIAKHQNKTYDNAGEWAREGKINTPFLNTLLSEQFFSAAPPKSTGRELFNLGWLEKILTTQQASITAIDVQATLTALTAKSIADAIQTYAPHTEELFICGGGTHNDYLVSLLKQYTHLKTDSTSTLGIDPDWVEASAFAWLAKQTMENKPGNLPEVTGATQAVVLGAIYLP